MKIEELAILDNIAEKLDETELNKIAMQVTDGFKVDERSKAAWQGMSDEVMKIAKQAAETPMEGRSDVKYPLIPIAAMQFASRTYPEIVRTNKVINCSVVGDDPTGMKEKLATKISDFMSWQLLVEDEEWQTSLDKLLNILPIVGTVFKKTFYNSITKKNESILCMPDDVFVNNRIKTLASARRVTHRQYMYLNDIIEMIREGVYSDIEEEIIGHEEQNYGDPDAPHIVLEQLTYIDLDEDGYKEPYIVTLHQQTNMILRIVACFDFEHIEFTEKGKIKKIPVDEYFTDFHFIPSPDGSFYSIGFGQLLYPMNMAANSLLNQMIDSGTLANRQSGFLGRGFRGNPKDLVFKPGEWKKLDISGDDITKNVKPLEVAPPSQVLFQLLEFIVAGTKELSSVTESMQGETPGQNTPATTVLTMLQEGLKLYSSLLKRLFRSLTKEFRILAKLNSIHLDNAYLAQCMGTDEITLTKDSFISEHVQIYPLADPSLSSDALRLARAQALMHLMPMVQPPGQEAILANFTDSLQVPTNLRTKILQIKQPPPDPKMVEAQTRSQEVQHKAQMDQMQMKLDMMQAHLNGIESKVKAGRDMAEIQKIGQETLLIQDQRDALRVNTDFQKFINELSDVPAAASIEENAAPGIKVTDVAAQSAPAVEAAKSAEESDEQSGQT